MRRRYSPGCPCCGSSCSTATVVELANDASCCMCAEGATIVFDVPVDGRDTFPFTSHSIETGREFFRTDCILDGDGNSFDVTFHVPDDSDYWGLDFSLSPNETCDDGIIVGTILSPPSSYHCEPEFTAVYPVTSSNVPFLYALGVRTATVKSRNGEALCGCGVICKACGGTKNLLPGTVTDENGTHSFGFTADNNSLVRWTEGRTDEDGHPCTRLYDPLPGSITPTWTMNTLASATAAVYKIGAECSEEGTIKYGIAAWCVGDGTIGVALFTPLITTCVTEESSTLVYDKDRCLFPYWIVYVTPTCTSTSLVANATFDPLDYGDDLTIDPPISSALISLALSLPRAQLCCTPCPIPKRDLVLTSLCTGCANPATQYPLTYSNPSQGFYLWSWSTGSGTGYRNVTLSCHDGHVSISSYYWVCGDEFYTRPSDLVSYTCNPFHLFFSVPRVPFVGICQTWDALVNSIGYNNSNFRVDVTIDE